MVAKATGSSSDWSRGNAATPHICAGAEGGYLVERNAAKLGKVKTGRSCINSNKLEDLKLDVAMALVKEPAKSGGINAVAWCGAKRRARGRALPRQ